MPSASERTAVFFDFGGTLFSYRRVGGGSFDLLLEAARRLGIEADPRSVGTAYRDASRAAYAACLSRPYYLHRDLFEDTFRRYVEALGAKPSPELVAWFHAAQRELVTKHFELREDCIETLHALRKRGLHVSVVSNIDDDYLQPMIERAGLSDLLCAWTSSEEARSCKPDARIYHYACEKADCTPSQVWFVGDSPEQDVAGARAVGMTAVLLREPGAQPPGHGVGAGGEPHHEIERLGELLDLLGD